ncbi:hypothetical protein [Candidatus Enterovibrio escicola]|uniref:Uncharacterized protein n=1 Tax=Candidatus Enterovibrio escicola TaxID=1927127 RepID=A0A2A5T2M6_9GAMM|nr:hypothetical protein [Candidatus Enterovibrio escacola]PCS22394.1 hypothetical protein BTN49_2123 [Candidatus Enterovibrio escacola]
MVLKAMTLRMCDWYSFTKICYSIPKYFLRERTMKVKILSVEGQLVGEMET